MNHFVELKRKPSKTGSAETMRHKKSMKRSDSVKTGVTLLHSKDDRLQSINELLRKHELSQSQELLLQPLPAVAQAGHFGGAATKISQLKRSNGN